MREAMGSRAPLEIVPRGPKVEVGHPRGRGHSVSSPLCLEGRAAAFQGAEQGCQGEGPFLLILNLYTYFNFSALAGGLLLPVPPGKPSVPS